MLKWLIIVLMTGIAVARLGMRFAPREMREGARRASRALTWALGIYFGLVVLLGLFASRQQWLSWFS